MIAAMYDFLFAPFADFAFMRRALVACFALALGSAPIGGSRLVEEAEHAEQCRLAAAHVAGDGDRFAHRVSAAK